MGEFTHLGELAATGNFATMNIPANGLEDDNEVVPKKRLTTEREYYKFLKPWRKALGLTQQEVAERLDVSVSTVSHWERGERQVDLSDLSVIAEKFGVHPAALLFEPGEDNPVIRMAKAADLARTMDDDALNTWLEMGAQLPKKASEG